MPGDQTSASTRSPWQGLLLRLVGLALLIGTGYLGLQLILKRPVVPPEPNTPPPGASTGAIAFENVTRQTGIRFQHYDSASPSHFIHETIGSGVAWIDYDADGWLDLLFLQDAPLPGSNPPMEPLRHALYRNRGDGTFQDVTEQVGLAHHGFGLGGAVGDFDNDGYDDLAISYLDQIVLYRNVPDGKHGRRFEQVRDSGLANPHFATSLAWGDIDGDGLLDLYVCNYVETDLKQYPVCIEPKLKIPHTCSPVVFPAVSHRLFRNLGGGKFEDVSVSSGIAAATPAHGLGVVMVDLDGDGWLDIFVANDMRPAYLFHNQGQGKFRERATLSGCGFAPDGANMAGMGLAVGDIDRSGRPSILVSNFQDAPNVLFLNRGKLSFVDATFTSGLGYPSLRRLGFGTEFLDADLDGQLDLVVVNGHVSRVAPEAYRAPFAQEAQSFRGMGDGKFVDVSASAGDYFRERHVGRGLAWADFDRDGRPDLAIGNCGGPGILLRNVSPGQNHWLRLVVEGNPETIGPTGRRSPRSAIGTRVEFQAGGQKLVRYVLGGGSYLSASDRSVLVGLNKIDRIERATIHWPSGAVQELGSLDIDQSYRVREGTPPVPILTSKSR